MKFKPYEYQLYAINRIIEQPIVGLFLDMGMGKTICTLTAVAELINNNRVLVIAPLRVAESTWSREAEKFSHTAHLKVVKVLGSKENREAALTSEADLYVINRENVAWLWNTICINGPLIWLLLMSYLALNPTKQSDSRHWRRYASILEE